MSKKLSHLIQDGSIPPGTRLLEIELANQLGVSRGPLREALRILETMGLVETIPGKGSYTAALSRADAQEIYSLRILLEQEAVRLVCQRASAEEITCLEELLAELLQAAEEKAFTEVSNLDIDFHHKIWELSSNTRLLQTLEGLIRQARRYLSIQTHLYETPIVGVEDHLVILDGIRARDCYAAADAMRQHLEKAAAAAVENIKD
ncbi:MAG: GntR family transcriptional regulator [Anaerolineaceae bacterium]|nr:GntR family transcriptional regulator [Anaerolineaceae bacterium]